MDTVEELVTAAKAGDPHAFERLALRHRPELLAFCYQLLGSPFDADDALQEAYLAAWTGLSGVDRHAPVRGWLYRFATHACLRTIGRRPRRVLPPGYGPARTDTDLGQPVTEPIWLEPWPGAAEGVELARVAALQYLPGNQRAALVLRDGLGLPAAEVADLLDTTAVSINGLLPRARQALADRTPAVSQADELGALGDAGRRKLVEGLAAAWEAGDVDGLTAWLTDDARFTMPPRSAWFSGRSAVARVLAEQVFTTDWRVSQTTANGQLALACHQGPSFGLGALAVLTVRSGQVAELTAFLDPQVHALFAQ